MLIGFVCWCEFWRFACWVWVVVGVGSGLIVLFEFGLVHMSAYFGVFVVLIVALVIRLFWL